MSFRSLVHLWPARTFTGCGIRDDKMHERLITNASPDKTQTHHRFYLYLAGLSGDDHRWDATWTKVPGDGWDPFDPASPNNWQNQSLFDFEYRALPALKLFREA